MPTTPQNDAGCRIEPPVSDPNDPQHKPAATEAALPPELPPGTLVISQGFKVGPNADVSVELPIANSSLFVFPIITAPEFKSLSVTVDSYGGIKFPKILLAQVVLIPLVQRLSLIAKGIHAKGGRFSPDLR